MKSELSICTVFFRGTKERGKSVKRTRNEKTRQPISNVRQYFNQIELLLEARE
jgi:hypothetical protein